MLDRQHKILFTLDADDLFAQLQFLRSFRCAIAQLVIRLDLLDIDVVVVYESSGNPPGGMSGVTDGKEWHAREGGPGQVEVRRLQVRQEVYVRQAERLVWIAGKHRFSRLGVQTGDGPVITARLSSRRKVRKYKAGDIYIQGLIDFFQGLKQFFIARAKSIQMVFPSRDTVFRHQPSHQDFLQPASMLEPTGEPVTGGYVVTAEVPRFSAGVAEFRWHLVQLIYVAVQSAQVGIHDVVTGGGGNTCW